MTLPHQTKPFLDPVVRSRGTLALGKSLLWAYATWPEASGRSPMMRDLEMWDLTRARAAKGIPEWPDAGPWGTGVRINQQIPGLTECSLSVITAS